MAWSVDKTREEMRHWVQNQQNAKLQFRDQVEAVEKRLAEATPETLHLVVPHLQRLAVWETMNGGILVLDDQPEGWERIQHGLSLRYWSQRMLIHVYDNDPSRQPRIPLVQAALCLNHLLASGEWERAAWMGERMEAEFGQGPFKAWSGTPMEPFSVALYQLWKQLPLGRGLPNPECLRPYRPVLEAWTQSPERFGEAVKGACDYHLRRIEDPTDEDFPEFYYPLYDVFPAEILAIRRVRKRVGLETPDVNHPLLRTPLADPPANLAMTSGPTLGSVIQVAQKLWPNFTA